MKDIITYINESYTQNDLRSLESLLGKFIHAGTCQEYQKQIYGNNFGNKPEYCKEVQDILSKYDECMDEIMYIAISGKEMPAVSVEEIKQIVEKEKSSLTDVIQFLKELGRFLHI